MNKFIKPRLGWALVLVFFLLGLFTKVALVGYSFSAYLLWGCSALLVCYQLLNRLASRNPKLAIAFRRILTVGIILVVTAGLITGGIIMSASTGSPQTACDYVVVLGAGVNGTVPSLSLRERIHAAYDYLTKFPEAVCVVSGCQGDGEDITEALCIYNELTAMGLSPDRVWMEEYATNTRENLQLSLDIIEARTGIRPTKIGIVSSEYHLFRAGLFARELQVESFGIPARTSWFSLRLNYYLREIAAVWYYTILGG